MKPSNIIITETKLKKWLAAAEKDLKCCITNWETINTEYRIERLKKQIAEFSN